LFTLKNEFRLYSVQQNNIVLFRIIDPPFRVNIFFSDTLAEILVSPTQSEDIVIKKILTSILRVDILLDRNLFCNREFDNPLLV
jgi:hypothetical protein